MVYYKGPMHITEQVKTLLQAHMPDAQIVVEDPMADGTHLRAIIVSPRFAGQSRVARHRAVYAALGDAFSGPLHALQIVTRTPEEMPTP